MDAGDYQTLNQHGLPRPLTREPASNSTTVYDLAFTCIDLESAQAASPVSILLTCIHSRWYYVKGEMHALTAPSQRHVTSRTTWFIDVSILMSLCIIQWERIGDQKSLENVNDTRLTLNVDIETQPPSI